jgi:hypothetical protein
MERCVLYLASEDVVAQGTDSILALVSESRSLEVFYASNYF